MRLAGGLAALAAALLFATALSAASGDLDVSFDGDGKAVTDFGGGSDDRGYAVAAQPDGKIVVVGETRLGNDIGFGVVRYRQAGGLDPAFDSDGKVRTDFGAATFDQAVTVVVQRDGKIVVAGSVAGVTPGTSFDFGLARYNANGSLDSTFDGDGKVVTDLRGGGDVLTGIALQADGRIVSLGFSRPPGPGPYDWALTRYNVDGTLDLTFDGDGKVFTPFSAGSDDLASDVVVDPAGRVVAAGQTRPPGGNSDTALARYTRDGALDPTFDADGKFVMNILPFHDYATGIAVQADGKLVVAMEPSFFLARLNANGTLDPSFGSGGTQRTVFDVPGGGAQAWNVAIQRDGKIVAGGSTFGSRNDFALARYTRQGAPDPSFSGDGQVTADIAGSDPGIADVAYGMAIDSRDRIVLAGLSGPPGPLPEGAYDFVVARFVGIPPACVVPRVTRATLRVARGRLARARCRVGRVRRAYSRRVRKGRVISQRPRAGTRLAQGGRVNLVVSRGPKKR
jgi:uncharacterized delta-60 repeat protein